MSDQFLRKASLIMTPAFSDQGIDLSQLRFKFRTAQSDVQTPNHAYVRVYNLADNTVKSIQNAGKQSKFFVANSPEYARLTLQAGYQDGAFGIIFDGTITQMKTGRENPTDTYLDLFVQDGDIPYNFGVVNATLAKGATPQEELDAIIKDMNLPKGYVPDLPKTALTRGKVLFGLGRDALRDLAKSTNTTWSIQNGQIQILPLTGYLPGEAVVLNSKTGLIGLPEQTPNGINVRCLLNPKLRIGGLVQIDNKSIQQAFNEPQFTALNIRPKITADGFYRLYVVEHEGDTRGQPWYSNLVCLAIDKTAPANQSVLAAG